MTPLIRFLQDGRVPENDQEVRRVVKEAVRYTLVGQWLYRRGFAFPLLRCLDGNEVEYVMKEVLEGVCGTHIGGQALASKIARAGYYWPTLRSDCMSYVKRCDKCQRFAKGHKAPQNSCTQSHHHGHSANEGGQVKFLIIVVNYFTKWVEAEPIATISAERVKCFFWKKIICQFGLPTEIVSDNGTKFASKTTAEFCKELGIKQIFTLSNGQAEAANKVILKGLRRRLEEAKGRWAEELPQVLWSYQTIPHSTTNETPFHLTFETEAVILVEIGESSACTTLFEPSENKDELRANLDIEGSSPLREFAVKTKVAKMYNQRVIPRGFKPQDLVLRKVV
ncbi:Tf2-11, partial [Mucuna pruriens]